ncbi:hypothetical protein AA313_de0208616 [Arthrobotrys entomopaga]|nr:hypothetical protein AA313_de0208616 [Arthrobotrys entomopaga]
MRGVDYGKKVLLHQKITQVNPTFRMPCMIYQSTSMNSRYRLTDILRRGHILLNKTVMIPIRLPLPRSTIRRWRRVLKLAIPLETRCSPTTTTTTPHSPQFILRHLSRSSPCILTVAVSSIPSSTPPDIQF